MGGGRAQPCMSSLLLCLQRGHPGWASVTPGLVPTTWASGSSHPPPPPKMSPVRGHLGRAQLPVLPEASLCVLLWNRGRMLPGQG